MLPVTYISKTDKMCSFNIHLSILAQHTQTHFDLGITEIGRACFQIKMKMLIIVVYGIKQTCVKKKTSLTTKREYSEFVHGEGGRRIYCPNLSLTYSIKL